MIPKRIDIEPENDNFGALADYIAAAKDEGEKLENLWIENCNAGDGFDDLDLAKAEIKATQALNQRTKSGKTYHLMLSFRDEHPPLGALKDIEREFAKALGYAEHQRVVGTHVNTDNFHMHIAINKIHPETLKAHTPLRDFKTLERVARAMELKHGLKVDLGRSDKQEASRRPQRATAKEAHTWEQSFDGYVRENQAELVEGLRQAESWQDLHSELARLGIELQQYARGLVIADAYGDHHIKASSIDRGLSIKVLESRFGRFEPPSPENRPFGGQYALNPQRSTMRLVDRQAELSKILHDSLSWSDLHAALAAHGVEAKLKGNGLVLDGGKALGSVKGSQLGRDNAKKALESRLGPFQVAPRQVKSLVRQIRQMVQSKLLGQRRRQGIKNRWISMGQAQRQRQYKKRPTTKYPGQGRLWRRFLTAQRDRKTLLSMAFKTWKDFLLLEAATDPLALAIVVSQRQILQAMKPSPQFGRTPIFEQGR